MDELAILFVELGAIFAALALLGMLANRLGVSAIPFYLLAGLAFGDGGLVEISAAGPFVEVAAEIGVILLLLLLGLEFTSTELMASLKRHRTSGLVDFVLNASPGLVAGWLLGLPLGGILAVGGLTWISSSGIVARVLGDLGRLGNRETPSVLSLLVLEDIAMALYLPILVVVLSGGGPLQALAGVSLALGAVIFILLVAHFGSERLERMLDHPDDEQVLFRVLGLTLLVAGVAQGVGASAAVGAFLVGIAVPHQLADRARQLLGPLRDLFASVFFVAFGLSTVPANMVPMLVPALLLALVGIITKLATGWYAASRDGVGRPGRLRAGAALVSRGEFSVVIAGLAVTAGVAQVGPLAATYVMVLAVLGPIIARLADPLGERLLPRRV